MKLTLLELFGGIGAPMESLKNLGVDIRGLDYVEIIPYAVQAYNALHPKKYESQNVLTWNLDVDLLVHGSPCQDFSKNGLNNINTGRSILFERTLEIIEFELLKRPKFVMWENVVNLLSNGNKVAHIKYYDYYIETMERLGYVNHTKIINAYNHGVPQKRNRVFVVSHLPEYSFEFPESRNYVPDIVDYLEENVDFDKYKLSENEMSLFFVEDSQLYIRVNTKAEKQLVEEYDVINVERPNSKTRRGRVGKRVANTITTSPNQAIYFDGKLRFLTSKEIFRLMGFSDNGYSKLIAAGLTEKQIIELSGNSICVPVLEDLMQGIINELERG